jgi:hypothetical protein
MSAQECFVYEPLSTPSAGDSFRFLRLLPDLLNGTVHLTIRESVITREESGVYIALSYTWGPDTDNRQIYVNGRLLTVRRNLWDFLHLARHCWPGHWFWIDAICIDQSNLEERSQQVSLMWLIYAKAAFTLTWLGPFCDAEGPPHSQITLSDNHDPVRLTCVDGLFKDFAAGEWPPNLGQLVMVSLLLEKIFRHPYWSRLWVLQEITSCHDKIIVLPDYVLDWNALFAVQNYFSRSRSVSCKPGLTWPSTSLSLGLQDARWSVLGQYGVPRPDPEVNNGSNRLWNRIWSRIRASRTGSSQSRKGILDGKAFPQEIEKLLQTFILPMELAMRDTGGEPATNAQEFLDLLEDHKILRCSDRRDKIYGLQRLHLRAPELRVDYKDTVYELFFRTCRFLLSAGVLQERPERYVVLLETLNLGPIDLVFGDEERRSQLHSGNLKAPVLDMADDGSVSRERSLNSGLVHVLVEGVCHHCGSCYKGVVPESEAPSYCFVQCHQIPASSDDPDKQATSPFHCVFYQTRPAQGLQVFIDRQQELNVRFDKKVLYRPLSFGKNHPQSAEACQVIDSEMERSKALMHILEAHEAFYAKYDDPRLGKARRSFQGSDKEMRNIPSWAYGRPSQPFQGFLHERLKEHLQNHLHSGNA